MTLEASGHAGTYWGCAGTYWSGILCAEVLFMRKDFIKSPLSAVLPDFVLFLLSSLQTYLPLPGSVALTDEIWQHFLKKQTKKIS